MFQFAVFADGCCVCGYQALEDVESGDQSVMDRELAEQQEELEQYIPLNVKKATASFDRETKNYLDPDDISEEEFDSDPELDDDFDGQDG